MISSPCAKCHRKSRSKQDCLRDCEIIQAMQDHQVSLDEDHFTPAIDYAEEGRFLINTRGIKNKKMGVYH